MYWLVYLCNECAPGECVDCGHVDRPSGLQVIHCDDGRPQRAVNGPFATPDGALAIIQNNCWVDDLGFLHLKS